MPHRRRGNLDKFRDPYMYPPQDVVYVDESTKEQFTTLGCGSKSYGEPYDTIHKTAHKILSIPMIVEGTVRSMSIKGWNVTGYIGLGQHHRSSYRPYRNPYAQQYAEHYQDALIYAPETVMGQHHHGRTGSHPYYTPPEYDDFQVGPDGRKMKVRRFHYSVPHLL